jgi:hypothetical protein
MKHTAAPGALGAFAFSLVLGLAGAARADVPPPNSTECDTKKPGDACTDDSGKAGACTSSTCTKLDYSHGTPPTTVSYPCTLCVAGGTADSGSGGDAGSTSGGSSSGGKSGCSMAPPVVGTNGAAGWGVAAFAMSLRRRRRSR